MSYRTRSLRREAKNTKRKLFFSMFVVLTLMFVTVTWLLPNFVAVVGNVTNIFKTPSLPQKSNTENPILAVPVLVIPYEATNSSQISIKGYAAAGSKVNIYLDDSLQTSATAGDDGNFESDLIDLNIGLNNITAKTVDFQGNESAPSKVSQITFDDEEPKLEVSQPQDGQSIQGERKLTVSGQTEPDIQVFVNENRVILDSEGKFSTIINLNDGENSINVKAVDRATNTTEITNKVTFQP